MSPTHYFMIYFLLCCNLFVACAAYRRTVRNEQDIRELEDEEYHIYEEIDEVPKNPDLYYKRYKEF